MLRCYDLQYKIEKLEIKKLEIDALLIAYKRKLEELELCYNEGLEYIDDNDMPFLKR